MTTAPQKKTLWAWTVATFFGTGFLRPGPGTYGSIATVLLWLWAASLLHHNTLHLLIATLIALAVVIAAGIPAATRVARESQRKDPGFVVIDEVAGQLIPLLFLPPDWPHVILAFVLFRFFDILKPPPIRRLESLPEGAGIVIDDLAAGLYALILTQLLLHLLHHLH
ncbi:MAG TPA: phosphatidylglycerophosphatase A [Acidobacteriaceae bacterium]|jgi:phosphatidylglycerophosphatase A|nr:phosphatidylglycerophosphatase A [Acidobacteriaceae bacterium]